MSRLSRMKIKKNTDETEKKVKSFVKNKRRKIIINKPENSPIEQKSLVENEKKDNKEYIKENTKEKPVSPFSRKRRRPAILRKSTPTIEDDNASFFDNNDNVPAYAYDEHSYETDKCENEENKPVIPSKPVKKFSSFSTKRRMKTKKRVISNTGNIEKNVPDQIENIPEERENNNNDDVFDFETRPTSKFLNNTRKPDIIIIPYSSFEPYDGFYKKDAHQETSNIRFTDSDRILAEKSGLAWD